MRQANVAQRRLIRRRAVLELLTRLELEHPSRLVCKVVPHGSLDRFDVSRSAILPTDAAEAQFETPDWSWLPRSAGESPTGMVFVYDIDPDRRPAPLIALAAPFPIEKEGVSNGLASLKDVVDSCPTVGIILIRLGRFAVGVAEKERLLVSKSDTRYVRGRHRAGGQSSNRFKRNREKWMREFYDKASDAANNVFGDFGRTIDWLAMGGDEHVVNGFLERMTVPDGLELRILPRRLPASRPSRAALVEASRDVWAWRVYEPPRL